MPTSRFPSPFIIVNKFERVPRGERVYRGPSCTILNMWELGLVHGPPSLWTTRRDTTTRNITLSRNYMKSTADAELRSKNLWTLLKLHGSFGNYHGSKVSTFIMISAGIQCVSNSYNLVRISSSLCAGKKGFRKLYGFFSTAFNTFH